MSGSLFSWWEWGPHQKIYIEQIGGWPNPVGSPQLSMGGLQVPFFMRTVTCELGNVCLLWIWIHNGELSHLYTTTYYHRRGSVKNEKKGWVQNIEARWEASLGGGLCWLCSGSPHEVQYLFAKRTSPVFFSYVKQ